MNLFTQSSFAARGIRSLSWRGDALVDWVDGGRSFTLDGAERPAEVRYAFAFDAVTTSPDGRFAMIYQRLGTKGLLLDDGRVVRELNRSFYHADAYEYPVALFNDADGRVLLAHCPSEYCRIELEDAETGQPLTLSQARAPEDFFHSRLAASPSGERLLSAGWVWHPFDLVTVYDVAQALADPRHLDPRGHLGASSIPTLAEESSACWLDDDRVAVAASAEDEADDEPEDSIEPCLRPCGLAVYDAARQICLHALRFDEPLGTIFAVGTRFVLSLYRHPKLIDLRNGEIVHIWDAIQSGFQIGSIIRHLNGAAIPPPMCFDAASRRFAIANGDTVTVITFESSTDAH